MESRGRRRQLGLQIVATLGLLAFALPAASAQTADDAALPAGCRPGTPTTVDYPGAVDCMVGPASAFDCNVTPKPYPACTYRSADRPRSGSVDGVVVHDIEGSAAGAIRLFRTTSSGVSSHYVVGRDGTVYQLLREKDIAYQAGNLWFNEHTVSLEHEGWAATGWQWYNAAQYAASAKLTAHLLGRYHLPADRAHVLSHGTIPRPAASSANHTDPGPYWLWDHYLGLVTAAGSTATAPGGDPRVFALRTSRAPGPGGAQTPADFGYFYLYHEPSTTSALIPQAGDGTDVLDETDNVEAGMSYYALGALPDAAGTGATMVEIWYGHADAAHAKHVDLLETARRAWLAVPPGVWIVPGVGHPVTVGGAGTPVYGAPIADAPHTLGSAPAGAVFVAMKHVRGDAGETWYAIAFDHRLAYVPAGSIRNGSLGVENEVPLGQAALGKARGPRLERTPLSQPGIESRHVRGLAGVRRESR